MIKRHHPSLHCAAPALRRTWAAILPLGLALGLTGCRHKTAPLVLPTLAQAPVELEVVPPPDEPILVETEAENAEMVPPPSLPSESVKLPRRRRPAAPAKEAPPVEIASAAPAAAAIGSLSSGGESNSLSREQVKDLIATIQKRVSALPHETAEHQKAPIRQVVYFLKQAQEALDSGDAEGARNLATKAGLLMDDIEK